MISCDTNVLIYLYDPAAQRKRDIALQIQSRLFANEAPLAGQVCSEFLNAAIRKGLLPMDGAVRAVGVFARMMTLVEQQHSDRGQAARLASLRNLQFYDALLCTTLARAGVTTLLSEDMADGASYGGLTVLSPFNPANQPVIDRAFAGLGA